MKNWILFGWWLVRFLVRIRLVKILIMLVMFVFVSGFCMKIMVGLLLRLVIV